jgi:branched-subunit amino acid permease
VTWLLYAMGASVALVAELAKVPPLAFALGMYLPLPLTTPLLVGGFISHLVKKSTKDKELAERRNNRGTLISSGFIAGGALMGIVLAVLKLTNLDHYVSLGISMVLEGGRWVDGAPASWFGRYGQIISLVAFVLLCSFVYWDARRQK